MVLFIDHLYEILFQLGVLPFVFKLEPILLHVFAETYKPELVLVIKSIEVFLHIVIDNLFVLDAGIVI